MLVDDALDARTDLDPDRVEVQARGDRAAAGGHQHLLGSQLGGPAVGAGERHPVAG